MAEYSYPNMYYVNRQQNYVDPNYYSGNSWTYSPQQSTIVMPPYDNYYAPESVNNNQLQNYWDNSVAVDTKFTFRGPALATNADTFEEFSLALEGLNSGGIPTRTTPTLTPTTLRNIEQTFLELQSSVVAPPIAHQNEAGFVPPAVHSLGGTSGGSVVSLDQKFWHPGNANHLLSHPRPPFVKVNTAPTTQRRSMGGRRPAHNDKLTPEEEERRRIRRERNKLAAARCRKRRMDHTNTLINETEIEEDHKKALQEEIQQLQNEKDELMFVLEAHRALCPLPKDSEGRVVRVKAEIMDESENASAGEWVIMPEEPLNSASQARERNESPLHKHSKPSRPTSLNVASYASSLKGKNSEVADGVPIQTPSAGIFNFDSLMDGGTGLTPVSSGTGLTPLVSGSGLTPLVATFNPGSSTGLTPLIPSCSSQQRIIHCATDLSSPDSVPSKLVSL